jgi:hypothetical protein
LKERLAFYKGESVPIEFKDEPDTIAFYGDPEKLPSKLEALEYYVDISDVKKAVEVFRNLPTDGVILLDAPYVTADLTKHLVSGSPFL